ncbi:abasic site processing protein HMCES [Hyalella azteca]|uniref:Abasic site processing protein HMCES n=1 Tax=Hyalella azteca TaxID=294128 RepID=A0A8B7MZD4_HYAAZ|nr:abasic site processing protein HMCES [Hyalella azteca]
MCGRTACTLGPEEWCAACQKEGVDVAWRDASNSKQIYSPNYNLTPTMNSPVIVNGALIQSMTDEKQFMDYVIQPMMWNLVPHFYKGSTPKNHGYKTNNARVESILEKPMFSQVMKKGQRCVVLCDGFYEWQTKNGNKTPYFIYSPQPENVKVWDHTSWGLAEDHSTEPGVKTPWQGLRPLMLAGLFSCWHSPEGEEVWSYTVLTTEAGKSFNWLHHRVPVVLPDSDSVKTWLDPSIEPAIALKLVCSDPVLKWHKVSSLVNNSRNNSKQCLAPFEQKNSSSGPGNPIMALWLKKAATTTSQGDELQGSAAKREARSDDDEVEDTSQSEKKFKT